MLTRLLDTFLLKRIEIVDVDRELTTHEVEQRAGDAGSSFRLCFQERSVALLPALLVGAELHQREIADAQQPALLKIRRCEAPASLQVAIEPIAKDVAERLACFIRRVKLEVWIARVEAKGQAERIEDTLGEHLMREPFGSRSEAGAIERRTKLPDFDKVVEMAGLQ